MSASDPRLPAADRSPIRAVLERLFVLMRTIGVHGDTHPLTAQTAKTVAESIELATPPFALQFVRQAVFQDFQLVTLDPNNFQRAHRLAVVLAQMKVNELAVEFVPDTASLIALGRALSQNLTVAPEIPGLRLRNIHSTAGGNEGEDVDPEVFAVAQMTRTILDAERLVGAVIPAWPWSQGVAIVRRMERAMDTDATVCLAFVEVAPGARSAPRRAVTSALHAMAASRAVGLSLGTQRAVAHAALAVGLYGLDAREGLGFVEAVERAVPALLGGLSGARLGSDPHRARVCAIVHSALLHAGAASRWHPTTRLTRLVYEMERARCPRGLGFDLSASDLLASLSQGPRDAVDGPWLAALLSARGVLPPGVPVQMADGRRGVVMGPGASGDPSRPRVYLDGRMVDAEGSVTLALHDGDVARAQKR